MEVMFYDFFVTISMFEKGFFFPARRALSACPENVSHMTGQVILLSFHF
jgi:hypothetical protein